MSFYQTYRPKKISELDLASVREVLLSSLSSGTISHAYLFVGPRGSGKTSTARIMAQIINCQQNVGRAKDLVEPCGECEACKTVAKGSSVDVIEIDAASNGLVDDIRELRDRVRLAPVQLSKKIYIIDEVHMVSTAGFNALLKTLEEPPAHAVFILCTTESQKVPETILSRCARVNFSKASDLEVVGSLMKAVKGEGLAIEEEVLLEIAQATDGSFREGHKLLEQLSTFGKTIDKDILIKVLGTASRQSIKKLLESVITRDSAAVIVSFEEMEKAGTKAPILALTILGVAKLEMEKRIREGEKHEIYLKIINAVIAAADKIKVSPLPLLPIEIALLSVCVGSGGEESALADRPIPKVFSPAQEKSHSQANDTVVKTSTQITESVDISKDQPKVEEKDKNVVHDNFEGGIKIEDVKTGWSEFLRFMSENNGSLAGMLRLVEPVYVEGKSLTISVTSRFQLDMLEREVKKKVIEEQMAKVWGPMTFKCVLTDKVIRTQPSMEDENISTETQISTGVDTVQGVMSAAEKIFG